MARTVSSQEAIPREATPYPASAGYDPRQGERERYPAGLCAGHLATAPEINDFSPYDNHPESYPTVSVGERVSESLWAVVDRYKQDLLGQTLDVPANPHVSINMMPVNPDTHWFNGKAVRARVGEMYVYSTDDPWQSANPRLVKAVEGLTSGTLEQVSRVQGYLNELDETSGHTDDVKLLTYLRSNRASGNGKNRTVITQALMGADEIMAQWIDRLPAAECLYPVARPDRGIPEYDQGKDEVSEIPSSLALEALTTGSKNGSAVREREAWAELVIQEAVDPRQLESGTLRITDLGTGTGDPGMRAGLSLLPHLGLDGKVQVTGVDIDPKSLAVGKHMATRFAEGLDDPNSLQFEGKRENILTEEGINEAVGNTSPHVIQSIGFSEYVPSDFATDPLEQRARELMKRKGCISAEEFHAAVYDNMPSGSIWLTGNMQPNPEGPFVTEGLGWGHIIMRTTDEYTKILERAGVPPETIQLYTPHPTDSAGVYNLVVIRKP